MAPLDLEGLEFKRFNEIPDFEEKLTLFLNSLDEELATWRDYVEKNGDRIIPHPIDGYACLENEKIVAICYFNLPKKHSLTYYIHKILPPKMTEFGNITKKEYQRKGIGTKVSELTKEYMRNLGYKGYYYTGNADNIALVRWAEKLEHRIFKKEGNTLYYVVDLYKKKSNKQ